MLKTRDELDRKMNSIHRKKEQSEIEKKVREEIKQKIAQEIKAAEQAREETGKPAIRQEPLGETTLQEDIGDTFEDIVDTIKAVASVIEDRFQEQLAKWKKE